MTDPTERDPTLPSSQPEPASGGGLDPAAQPAAEESASVETEAVHPDSEETTIPGDTLDDGGLQ